MEIADRGWIDKLILTLTFILVAFQMVSSQVFLLSTVPYLNFHIMICILLTIVHIARVSASPIKRIWCYAMAVLTVLAFGYIQINWEMVKENAYFNTPMELAVGVCLIFLALESTRLGMGAFLPILCVVVVVYGFVGQYLPEPFKCQSMGLDQTLTNLSIGFDGGIYAFLHISANFLFLFILFGGVLNATGASKLFIMLGRIVMSRIRGGAAMMAVVASAGVGSITGSAAANVAVTGPITIPLMKNTGFKPQEAGGIEAAASNGGQIMPPIMGMVAFAMAGLTGIPYLKIVLMAIIPALIYFFNVGLYVYFLASKRNMPLTVADGHEKIDRNEWFFMAFNFLVPILVIILLLVLGYSINFVGFWAIISVLAVSLLRKKTRPSLRTYVDGFIQGTHQAAVIAASTACVGLILSTLNMSGLGVKLVLGIEAWSHGSLFFSLVLIFVFSVIMGMGGASVTAYIIVSVFTVPALQKMGMTFEQGHFFAMFVAVFAFLTPPVAMVSLIAARVANAPYMKTAIESTKAATGGFLMPFLFAYCPLMLLQPKNVFFEGFSLVACIFVLIAFQGAAVGYYISRCTILDRLWHAATSILLLFAIINGNSWCLALGMAMFILITIAKMAKKGRGQAAMSHP
jgi:TRAP transporter 4TM/12TM fusion protein